MAGYHLSRPAARGGGGGGKRGFLFKKGGNKKGARKKNFGWPHLHVFYFKALGWVVLPKGNTLWGG